MKANFIMLWIVVVTVKPSFEMRMTLKLFSSLCRRWKRYNAIIHAYCLMSNHYHLLIETPKANLSEIIKYISGLYAQRYPRGNWNLGVRYICFIAPKVGAFRRGEMTRNSRSIAKSFNAAMEETGRAHDLNLNRYGYIARNFNTVMTDAAKQRFDTKNNNHGLFKSSPGKSTSERTRRCRAALAKRWALTGAVINKNKVTSNSCKLTSPRLLK